MKRCVFGWKEKHVSQLLPGPMSFEAFESFRGDFANWREAAIQVARRHGFSGSDPRPFASGTNLICALGAEAILKIYPPMLRHQFVAERATLCVLQGKLSVEVPVIIAEGECDAWPYLLMSRLPGETGEVVWPSLSESQKERVLERMGRLIAEVQSVPPGDLRELDPKWQDFLPRQIARARSHHRELGLPARYLDGLEDYLRGASERIPSRFEPVILTGEYIPENFLLSESSPGEWSLSGLIDFGDVMTGYAEYDLLGPSVFLCEGKPGRVRSLLRGYGYSESAIDGELTKRLMTLFLLHRFGDLVRQVKIDDWQTKAPSLPELERLIWPI